MHSLWVWRVFVLLTHTSSPFWETKLYEPTPDMLTWMTTFVVNTPGKCLYFTYLKLQLYKICTLCPVRELQLIGMWNTVLWFTYGDTCVVMMPCWPGLSLFFKYPSLPGFLLNHPGLVLMTLLSLELVLLSTGRFVLSCLSSFFVTVFLCSSSFASYSWLWLDCCL